MPLVVPALVPVRAAGRCIVVVPPDLPAPDVLEALEPAVLARDDEAPGVRAPEVLAREVRALEVVVLEALAPEAFEPELLVPEVVARELLAPELLVRAAVLRDADCVLVAALPASAIPAIPPFTCPNALSG